MSKELINEGLAEVDGRLALRMQPVGGSVVTLRPTVVEVGVRGLFDADHLFILESHGATRSRLVQREQFSGLLVPFVQRSLDRGTLPAFHAMNAALKDRAERATASRG